VISILYIDNDPVLLDAGKRFLERDTNSRVDCARTAGEALQLLKNGSVDAIISDHHIPELDCRDILNIVHEKYPGLPVIIFSDKGRDEIFPGTLSYSADDYIKKDGDPKSQFADVSRTVKRAVEFRESVREVARLKRIDSILWRISESIVHITDRMNLVQEVCKTMVQEGEFVMAWVGFEDPDTHRINRVVASGIVDDFFVKVRSSSDDTVNGEGPSVSALRKGKYSISNDIHAYPGMAQWEEDAITKGYRSVAAFPLGSGKDMIGVITLYSRKKDHFTNDEIRLINEISDEISCVLRTRETEENCIHVQKELETSEHRLNEIVNFLPTATFAVDMQGNLIVWNRSMEKLTNVGAEKVLGLGNYEYSLHILGERIPGLLDLVFAHDTEIEKYHYTDIQRDQHRIRAQIQVSSLKGKPATLEMIASLLFDQDGQLSGAIQSMQDIREMHQKDEKFRRLFETTDHGIIILDPESKKIVDVNSFFVTLTGSSLEILLGRTLGDIGFSKEALPVEQFFVELVKKGDVRYKDIPLLTKDNHIIDVEFTGRLQSFDDRQVIQCSIYDISDQKRTESARILSRKNLDTFSSIIRHDILNQLMVVSGSLELASYGAQDPDLLKHLVRAQTATKTVQRQIIFTREYENLGTGIPTWQQVSVVIRQAFLEAETESIILNVHQDAPEVFADPLFEKVFYHLFKYSYKYGETVSRIEVNFTYTPTGLIITVTDNGIGISAENKTHLFEWRSGNEKTPGLILAQKILSSTGITIRETGEFRNGIRFEIIVPVEGFRRVSP
jgi:PAS domain S-box-containing protein